MSIVAEVTTEELRCDLEDRILTITFDRPAVLNAMSYPMLYAYLAALQWAEASPEVGVIIITGAGRAFSSGTDLSSKPGSFEREAAAEEAPADPDNPPADFGGIISLHIYRSSKPILAAVNGLAMGFGCTMTLPMDMRFASEDASFTFIFAKRGLLPEGCATWFLPRVVGITRALDWTLSGRKISAQEAQAAGLVTAIVPGDNLLDHVRGMASELIQSSSANSMLACRRALWGMLAADGPEDGHKLESRAMASLQRHDDFLEAVSAFREKRPISFSGRIDPALKGAVDRWLS